MWIRLSIEENWTSQTKSTDEEENSVEKAVSESEETAEDDNVAEEVTLSPIHESFDLPLPSTMQLDEKTTEDPAETVDESVQQLAPSEDTVVADSMENEFLKTLPTKDEQPVKTRKDLIERENSLKIREKELQFKKKIFERKVAEFQLRMEEFDEKLDELEWRIDDVEYDRDTEHIESRMDEMEDRLMNIEDSIIEWILFIFPIVRSVIDCW